MKKETIEHPLFNTSEAAERRYLQKLKADQSMFQAFFSSIPQCYCVPFYYPNGFQRFPQTNLLVKQSEATVNTDCLKSKINK